jgi:hypothetical protein
MPNAFNRSDVGGGETDNYRTELTAVCLSAHCSVSPRYGWLWRLDSAWLFGHWQIHGTLAHLSSKLSLSGLRSKGLVVHTNRAIYKSHSL